ncbi:MAG: type II toxin-antitoxin system RelE/ParE family toxin, partial [Deltaproteobacteria bacterium]|nr:type II toxin-antitoxin system RelE/ParE family toxin [Deltaproteobacteria bacterium]
AEHAGTAVALAFVAELEAIFRGLIEGRMVGVNHPRVSSRVPVKRIYLDRFPHAVVFLIEGEDVHVVAIEALRRRPGYWRSRLTAVDYSKESVVEVPWPQWETTAEGFTRTWVFVFVHAVDQQACLRAIPSEDGVEYRVAIGADPSTLVVTATAPAHFEPYTDKHYFNDAVCLFKAVEAQFGPLRTIQGIARNAWRGFR